MKIGLGITMAQTPTGGGSPPAPENLLTNGDFETGDLTGWANDSTGTTANATVNGSNQLVLARTAGVDEGRISQSVGAQPAGDYEVSWDTISGTLRLLIGGSFYTANPTTVTHPGGTFTLEIRATNSGGTFDNFSLVAV